MYVRHGFYDKISPPSHTMSHTGLDFPFPDTPTHPEKIRASLQATITSLVIISRLVNHKNIIFVKECVKL